MAAEVALGPTLNLDLTLLGNRLIHHLDLQKALVLFVAPFRLWAGPLCQVSFGEVEVIVDNMGA